jgi:hypothetical protein
VPRNEQASWGHQPRLLRVCEKLVRSPRKSTHHASWELQIPQSSVWHILCKCLDAKGYWLHTLDGRGRWPRPAFSFHSAQATTRLEFLLPLMNCFVCRWFCVPPLHHHIDSVLANSKSQNAFLSPVLAMFHLDCTLAMKPASTPWRLLPKQIWRDSLPIYMLLSDVSVLVVALPSSEIPEGLISCCADFISLHFLTS